MAKKNPIPALTAFVEKQIRGVVGGMPRPVSYDVRGRWDVDSENGIIIGSTTPVDVSYCLETTDVVFTPPTT